MKKSYSLGVGALCLIILGAGCTQAPRSAIINTAPIKIGYVGPLSGDVAAIGQNTLVGAQIAVAEINATGGIGKRNLQLITEDAKCDPKLATLSGQKLLSIDRVAAIIGGICSGETLALAPLAEAARVPLVSPGSSNPSITTAGDYTFRFYPPDNFQGEFAANYAVNNLAKKKIAILYCQNDYCAGIKDVFKKRISELGGTVTAEETYAVDSRDLRTQLIKIKVSGAELIYFPGYTEGVTVGLKQMKELGLTLPVIGTDSWTDPKVGEAAKASGLPVYYALPANKTLPPKFTNEMKKRTNSDTIIVSAPRAYDEVMALAKIMGDVGTDGTKIKNELYQLKNYSGIADTYSMDANGDMTIANYEMKKW